MAASSRAFVLRHTRLRPVPGLEEIRLGWKGLESLAAEIEATWAISSLPETSTAIDLIFGSLDSSSGRIASTDLSPNIVAGSIPGSVKSGAGAISTSPASVACCHTREARLSTASC